MIKIEPKNYSTALEISEADLSRCRQEMMNALDVFLKHIRYLMTLMTSMLGAGYAIFTYSLTNKSVPSLLSIGAIVVLLAMWLIGHYSYAIAKRYYKIYASNYIYSARLHWILGRSHPWINDLFRAQNIDSVDTLFSDQSVDYFIEAKDSADRHSWYYYRVMIETYRYVGLFSALGMTLCLFLKS